ncbi:MAG: energy-coupling factor transporter transmembrane component T family protein [Thermoguttaceae bacterium]
MTAYLDRISPIHRLDPRVKIAWSVIVSLLAMILGQPAFLAGLLVLTLLPWFLVRPPLARLRALFILVVLTVLGTMISQGFFYGLEPRTELLQLMPGLSLCREGVVYGAVVSLRLLSVMSAGVLAILATHASEMILALTKLRVPHWFAFMLTLALRFLPETVEQGKRILVAQQLRGAGRSGFTSVWHRFRFLVVPLLGASLRSARQVALAAEVRAYSPQRVPSEDLRLSLVDWVLLGCFTLLTALGVVAAILGYGAASGGIQ